jgi:hypothetical protein
MAELDCDCQLSRDGVVGARERVLMSALSALVEGVGELYGPDSTASKRLREVQEEVLQGRQWSLLQVCHSSSRPPMSSMLCTCAHHCVCE